MSSQLTSTYVLKALTTVAKSALQTDARSFSDLPLRVGRDTRTSNEPVTREVAERRARGMPANNDIYLRESGAEVFVSREHFLIEHVGAQFRLIDRQSTLGTWVDGRLIGGDQRGGECQLRSGDVIIPGSYKSGFIFKFLVGET